MGAINIVESQKGLVKFIDIAIVDERVEKIIVVVIRVATAVANLLAKTTDGQGGADAVAVRVGLVVEGVRPCPGVVVGRH